MAMSLVVPHIGYTYLSLLDPQVEHKNHKSGLIIFELWVFEHWK